MRGCLILVLAGLGFALGFALAPRQHGGGAPPMNQARAAHEVIVAIPAPTSARVPAALALPVHHRHSAAAPSATHSQAPTTTAASATTAATAGSVQSVGQTRPVTKQTQTTSTTQGTTTDPFDGQPHPKTGGSSTDGQPPPP